MHPIHDLDELRTATDDSLLRWAAQGMRDGARAWLRGAGVAVAVTDTARRDRLAVAGPPGDVAPIVSSVLADGGARYRLVGDAGLVTALCDELPQLTLRPPLGWMHTSAAPTADARAVVAASGDEPEIDALLTESLPDSLARPGRNGVARWWIACDDHGVAACACDAWSAPGVGLLAGVAAASRVQGRGFGRAVVSTALASLVSGHGTAALLVGGDNTPARRLYESLGMTYRSLRSAIPG